MGKDVSYWQDTKAVAIFFLSRWGAIPFALSGFVKELGVLLKSAFEMLQVCVGLLLLIVMPFFFWAAPVFVPLRRLDRRKRAARKKQAIDAIKGVNHG